MTSQVRVKNLCVAYGASDILRDVSVEFPSGTVTAVIGPSGCGKTTLLSTLNRMSDLTPRCQVRGEITLDGRDVREMDPIVLRRRVGMVFQKPNPFPMSIRENVLYGIKAGGLRVDQEAVVRDSLQKAALWEEVQHRLRDAAGRLSLGQQQRLCLARALAIGPSTVLMDEPTASLDPTSTARIEDSIRALRGELTIILVTHNLRQARRVSDRTVFLYEGRLIEAGDTRAFFEDPQTDLTRDYIVGALDAVAA